MVSRTTGSESTITMVRLIPSRAVHARDHIHDGPCKPVMMTPGQYWPVACGFTEAQCARRFRMADRDDVKDRIDKTADKAKDATDKAADKTKDAAENVGNKVERAGEKIKDKAD